MKMNWENVQALQTKAVREGDILRVSKTEKLEENDTNSIVVVPDTEFHNGLIEVDVKSSLLADAPAFARGFIGLAFRIQKDGREFESFYIRPTNGRDCTDPVRKHHAVQYFSYPGYTFSYFREFNINDFENVQSSIALDEWAHLKVDVNDDSADFYVNDALALSVNNLKHGDSRGLVGLFVDIGTDGFFRNLEITFAD